MNLGFLFFNPSAQFCLQLSFQEAQLYFNFWQLSLFPSLLAIGTAHFADHSQPPIRHKIPSKSQFLLISLKYFGQDFALAGYRNSETFNSFCLSRNSYLFKNLYDKVGKVTQQKTELDLESCFQFYAPASSFLLLLQNVK